MVSHVSNFRTKDDSSLRVSYNTFSRFRVRKTSSQLPINHSRTVKWNGLTARECPGSGITSRTIQNIGTLYLRANLRIYHTSTASLTSHPSSSSSPNQRLCWQSNRPIGKKKTYPQRTTITVGRPSFNISSPFLESRFLRARSATSATSTRAYIF